MAAAAHPLDTIGAPVRAEIIVTRSRFVTTLSPAPDRTAADRVIHAVRRELHTAGHHCTAIVLDPDGQRRHGNDDGEPAGTAGSPMLAVLGGARLTDVVAVVSRYFGGTLLGAGGLVRAYADAVSAALDHAVRLSRRRVAVYDLLAAHRDAGRLEHWLRTWSDTHTDVGAVVAAGHYDAEGARFRLSIPVENTPLLEAELASCRIEHRLIEDGQEMRAVPTH